MNTCSTSPNANCMRASWRTGPPSGTAIIMDPHTGEILAMANEPTFNPNEYRDFAENDRRNRAVQDLYEPGSTFKVVTASAAIEEKVLPIDALIDTNPGSIRIGSRSRHRSAAIITTACCRSTECHCQVEQRRRDQDRIQGRHRSAERLRATVWIRSSGLTRLSLRECRHRLGTHEVDRERARVRVDGLSGWRDATADGGRGQLRRQRRPVCRAACRSRRVSRQPPLRGEAESPSANDQC